MEAAADAKMEYGQEPLAAHMRSAGGFFAAGREKARSSASHFQEPPRMVKQWGYHVFTFVRA